MDVEEFRENGKEMIDFICGYMKNIETKDCAPTLEPGFLKPLLPDQAPENGESFAAVMKDVENKIIPGILHWNHPNFFAYFPSGNSYPSLLGELLSSAFGGIGFSWASCPSITELETIVMDWYAKAVDLPSFFLSTDSNSESKGGGVLQTSASECILVAMIAARDRAIKKLKGDKHEHESVYLPQLVAYSSKEAHSSVEKAAKMALIQLRVLETDVHDCFRGETLQRAIEKDVANGLTPCLVVATLGTTSQCAFDNLLELGAVCKKYSSIWFHIDGAYAGNSFILPEMRKFKEGLENADSFNTNPNKFLLTNFDASAFWVKDVYSLTSALAVDPLYLQHQYSSIDYRHYGIPLSRRFRSLKLFFVFRMYGISGLQNYMRNHIRLAKYFESLVKEDDRFEIRNDVHLGLVCFRLKNIDKINRDLLARINCSGKLHLTPAMVKGKYTIRFCVTYEHAKEEHIENAWNEIQGFAEEVLAAEYPEIILNPETNQKKRRPAKKLNRNASFRFSFTRRVSQEIYERQNSIPRLADGATPICVFETDDILRSLQNATKTKLDVVESDNSDQSANGQQEE